VFGFLDIIWLLKKTNRPLNWDRILDWVRGSVAATHLYLLLSYLRHNEIIDLSPTILTKLFRAQPSFGEFNLRIAHFLIERCLVEGRFPKGRVALRNLDIIWKSVLLDKGAIRNLLCIPRNMFLPFRLRSAILN
jgi:hypothetical protein